MRCTDLFDEIAFVYCQLYIKEQVSVTYLINMKKKYIKNHCKTFAILISGFQYVNGN